MSKTHSSSIAQLEKDLHSESSDSFDESFEKLSVEPLDPYREGTLKQIIRDKPRGDVRRIICGMLLLITYIGLAIGSALTMECHEVTDAEGNITEHCDVLCDSDEYVIGLVWGICLMIYCFSNSGNWLTSAFFKCIPTITLMYFLPGVLGTCKVFDSEESMLYNVASHYGLPAVLVLLCLSCDIQKMMKLGWRSIVMFLTGTVGIVVGGPLAVAIMGAAWPSVVCGDYVWRSLAYLAGSWIGGGANATAMADIFQPRPQDMAIVIAIDTFGGMLIMVGIFMMIDHQETIDRKNKADASPVKELINIVQEFESEYSRIPTAYDMLMIVSVAFFFTGVCNGLGKVIADGFDQLPGTAGEIFAMMAFNTTGFWRVMLATIIGLTASFTPLRNLENVGASKIGTSLLYFLILTIGMHMDITAVADNPGLFIVGLIWLLTHVILIAIVGVIIKAPLFYMCVGSQANIGAAASAPVVAAAFHPCLSPVGAIFGIFGYVIGTWAAWCCTMMMQLAAPETCPA